MKGVTTSPPQKKRFDIEHLVWAGRQAYKLRDRHVIKTINNHWYGDARERSNPGVRKILSPFTCVPHASSRVCSFGGIQYKVPAIS